LAPNIAALSHKGFQLLAERKLLHRAAEAVIGMESIHPRAQQRLLNLWSKASFGHFLSDDDLLFAFARKVLPPYDGGDQLLFRGQRQGARVGASWTISPHIALKFAWCGVQNVDPVKLALDGPEKPPAADGVILSAIVPASAIICAPCLRLALEGEYIVDPRGLEFSITPAAQAVDWVRDQVLEGLGLCAMLSWQLQGISERHGDIRDEPIVEFVRMAAGRGDAEAQELIDGGMLESLAAIQVLAPQPVNATLTGTI
jgi:hypothetical protein